MVEKAKFCVLKMEWKMFYATIPKGWYEVVGKCFDHEGLWSKKEEFWGNKPGDEFWGKRF